MTWQVAVRPWERVQTAWRSDPKGVTIDLLRMGMGILWGFNLLFILLPANQYFPNFASTARSYASQSLGGPGVADFVALHPVFFGWLIAFVTVYLTVALLFGITTRLACYVGIMVSVFFLWTQFLMTFMFPGGTDVGAHPLYILIYLMLIIGGAGKYLSADCLIWVGGTRHPRMTHWLFTPRPVSSPIPSSGDSPSSDIVPMGSADARRAFAVRSVAAAAVMLVLLAGAAEAGVQSATSSGPFAAQVNIVDVQYNITYPGHASSGAFGPAQQDGCFDCYEHVSPGNDTQEEAMLTNSKGGSAVTIESMNVSSPFLLTSSPPFPVTVPPGGMWMQIFGLKVPSTPGDYTVYIAFNVT